MRLRLLLTVLLVFGLTACTGVSTVRIVTNGPADVSVEGEYLGKAPVTFPLPWRNVDSVINYAQRHVTVTADGQVVYEKEISSVIFQKAQTGDFKSGSQYGTGRTYTLVVNVRPGSPPGPPATATRPATAP